MSGTLEERFEQIRQQFAAAEAQRFAMSSGRERILHAAKGRELIQIYERLQWRGKEPQEVKDARKYMAPGPKSGFGF